MQRLRLLLDLAWTFLRLGLTSFGGPVAHLGYLRRECVERRGWIDDASYADLVALCQFLPGPASSQVVFGLGLRRAGLAGALTASLCFTLPSALLMIALGYGVASLGDLAHAGWLHGLLLAAVSVVAQAVWVMSVNLCPDLARRLLAAAAAAAVLAVAGALAPVAAITACALAGAWIYRGTTPVRPPSAAPTVSRPLGLACLVLFASLLLVLPILARATGLQSVRVFDGFYRAGALVFGGGHVVLPLLRTQVVGTGWVGDSRFMAGYGAAQALPGPLFAFGGYLGTVIRGGRGAWLGGVWALLALFLPAWLLVAGVDPFWHRLRTRAWAAAALFGANAAVVGILAAAFCTPVCTAAIHSPLDAAAASLGFYLLVYRGLPSWALVALMAAAGPLLAT